MEQPPDADAARSNWRPRGGWLAVALALAVIGCAALVYLLTMPDVSPYTIAASSSSSASSSSVPAALAPSAPRPAPATLSAPAAPAISARAREGDADPSRDLTSYVMRGEQPSMPEVIQRLHERGVYSGLGAFSPPGTRPAMVGLAVPEDYVLPTGYVRHHQATDDGQRIEAILMFAPDFQLYDSAGQPVAMPSDRVVPPELAPPGLPVRRIVIPPPLAPGS